MRDTAIAPTAKQPQETHAYSLAEIKTILSVLPEAAATIFAVAPFTGLRRGEIRGMRWQGYRDGEIHVTQSVWESHVTLPKTFQSQGAVPVISAVAKMLEAHRMRCGNPNTGPIFAAINGKPLSLNNVQGRVILPALRKARLESLWHGWLSARRGLGSNLYALGVPEKTIQVILRHANVTTTNSYYIKTAPADAVAAMHKLNIAVPELGNDWATEANPVNVASAVN